MTIEIRPTDVLVVVDVQYDFLPGGSLAVADGDAIVPLINTLAQKFTNVVLTQDWHPADHISFASQHPGKAPFDTIELPYGTQVLWPDHCVWNSHGAEIAATLDIPHGQLIIRKGYTRAIDSYSGFQEADRQTLTGLAGYLNERDVDRLYIVGLATDYCVGWTAIDAAAAGFDVTVIEDATRAIDNAGSLAQAGRTWLKRVWSASSPRTSWANSNRPKRADLSPKGEVSLRDRMTTHLSLWGRGRRIAAGEGAFLLRAPNENPR